MKRIKKNSELSNLDKNELVDALLEKVNGGNFINGKCSSCSKCSKCTKCTKIGDGINIPDLPGFPSFPRF